jgi:hypothetical protein
MHALFAWLISHQPTVLFSQNKPATSNQPAVLFSQNKPAQAISHQPNEQASDLYLSLSSSTQWATPSTQPRHVAVEVCVAAFHFLLDSIVRATLADALNLIP